MAAKRNKSTPVIASTLVIAILFIGAIYFWNQQVKSIEERQKESSTAALKNSESDLTDLEAELKSVDFSQVDASGTASTSAN